MSKRRSLKRLEKAAVGQTNIPQSALADFSFRYPSISGGILESFAGAWQRNITVESKKELLTFSAVYTCLDLIAGDIGKLSLQLLQREPSGILTLVPFNSPFWPVLRRPNRFQNTIQFIQYWIVSKLLHGNAYILKQRDQRNMVVAMYILDPKLVTPLVTNDGDVLYQLKRDDLSQVDPDGDVVPASEIMHDRMMCLWHPLVGISPLYASGASATQGKRIQNNSEKFFDNMSRPSGILTSPIRISDESADRLKRQWEENFSGANIGKVAVLGQDMKYVPMSEPAEKSQLIEQLSWTVADVARTFHVPPYKLGLEQPRFTDISVLNQDYYSQALQIHIESIERLLDEGLALPRGEAIEYLVQFDLEGLLRMDPKSRTARNVEAVGGGIMAPNEARIADNLPPAAGGDTPYMQQQMFSLAALNKRPPPDSGVSPPKPDPDAEQEEQRAYSEFLSRIQKGLEADSWI